MDELAQIQQDFLHAQELLLSAFNRLLAYQRPKATRLNALFGPMVPKP